MKIAFVCDSYYPVIGGTSKVATKLAEGLATQGHEVHVYTVAWDHNKRLKSGEENIRNVQVHRYRYLFKIGNYGTIWPQVFFNLISNNYDVVHAHLAGHLHSLIAAFITIIKREKFIIQTHSPWGDEGQRSFTGKVFRSISYNIFLPIVFFKADKILCLTKYEEPYIKRYGGNIKKIVYFPNGIEKYFLDNRSKIKYGNNLQKPRTIAYVGAFNKIKNPFEFVDIAEALLKLKYNYNFIMIGPDEGLKNETINRIIHKNHFKILNALSDQTKLAKIYQSSDLLLVTSVREAFGNVVIEAYASGLPVIASEVGGLKYLVKNGVNGYLYKSGDISYAAELINSLFKDNIKIRQMAIRNHKEAQNYTWDKLVNKLLEIYK